MNTSIAALKRSKSNLDTLIGELNKVAEPQTQKQSYQDDRFWKPELDKSGNGFAVIRFMPAPDGEEIPWVRMFSHSFLYNICNILQTWCKLFHLVEAEGNVVSHITLIAL